MDKKIKVCELICHLILFMRFETKEKKKKRKKQGKDRGDEGERNKYIVEKDIFSLVFKGKL